MILPKLHKIPWKYVPGSQITIQMNEAFPKRLGGIDQTALDKEQKLIRPENSQTPEGLKSFETS